MKKKEKLKKRKREIEGGKEGVRRWDRQRKTHKEAGLPLKGLTSGGEEITGKGWVIAE